MFKNNKAFATQQLNEIKAAFELFDTNKTGSILARDVQKCLLSLGFNTKNPAVYTILTELEPKALKNESMSFDEFLTLIAGAYPKNHSYEEIYKLFQLFDPDATGFISASSLENTFKEIGEPFTQEIIDEMIRFADTNKDGIVTMDEFYKVMSNVKFAS